MTWRAASPLRCGAGCVPLVRPSSIPRRPCGSHRGVHRLLDVRREGVRHKKGHPWSSKYGTRNVSPRVRYVAARSRAAASSVSGSSVSTRASVPIRNPSPTTSALGGLPAHCSIVARALSASHAASSSNSELGSSAPFCSDNQAFAHRRNGSSSQNRCSAVLRRYKASSCRRPADTMSSSKAVERQVRGKERASTKRPARSSP
jgi:hypothetical protein